MIGQTISQYQVLDNLGESGMEGAQRGSGYQAAMSLGRPIFLTNHTAALPISRRLDRCLADRPSQNLSFFRTYPVPSDCLLVLHRFGFTF